MHNVAMHEIKVDMYEQSAVRDGWCSAGNPSRREEDKPKGVLHVIFSFLFFLFPFCVLLLG